jgi:pyruvate dehydrogenase E2 component (dihydrolipoamide acetyltransferase)
MIEDFVASPSTRAYARKKGVDLAALFQETGRKTLMREDIDAKLAGGAKATKVASSSDPWQVDHAAWGAVRVEPLSRLMQIASSNLSAAQRMIPAVTHHDRVPMDAVEAFRLRLKPEAAIRGVKLTPLSFHLMALARCLRAHPRFNASLTPDGAALVFKDYVHIGVAVDTPQGLIVPVIRDADQKGLFDIAAEIVELAKQATARKLRPDQIGGASMSITNLGGIAGGAFTPIVNPPELAILGVTRSESAPVWTGAEFACRLMSPIDLSYDHRAINGADAARFLVTYSALLSDPRILLL